MKCRRPRLSTQYRLVATKGKRCQHCLKRSVMVSYQWTSSSRPCTQRLGKMRRRPPLSVVEKGTRSGRAPIRDELILIQWLWQKWWPNRSTIWAHWGCKIQALCHSRSTSYIQMKILTIWAWSTRKRLCPCALKIGTILIWSSQERAPYSALKRKQTLRYELRYLMRRMTLVWRSWSMAFARLVTTLTCPP